jgi:three-Cys-motif partner protein
MASARERWLDLCETVAEPDGLPTWEEAGIWTRDKLFFWKCYIDITTTAMTDNRAFPGGVVYLDLFAGAGVCTLRGTGERFPGSALIAANAAKPFAKLIFCEKNRKLADACEARLKSTEVAQLCHVLRGDCNDLVNEVIALLPKRALTLTFIDPKGLDARFDTIARISQTTRSDIVALFADAYDVSRNEELHYRKNPKSKLDQVLGTDSDWRRQLDELESPSPASRRKLFAEIYQNQLRRLLGFEFFREKVMKSPQGIPLYRLIYASKDRLGLKFWDDALRQDSHGQKELF